MIPKLISKILEPRHFWRSAGFDELSELYSAQLLRSLAVSLIGLFTPIYLYKIGYSIQSIVLFHIAWFLFRPFFDVLAGYIIARIGPKHTMLLSSLIHIVYLGLLITIEDLRWPLALVAAMGSLAYGLHLLAVAVDFSKVKHSKHGGKELGYLDIMQKIGGVAGPLIGGLLANYTDPRYTVGLAMFILLLSTIPLFFSNEPVKVHQHITYRGLPIRRHIRDYIAVIPATIENSVSIIVWPFYAAVFILGSNTFAKLGVITAIGTATSLAASRRIGSVIDKSKGRNLLRISTIINAFLHLLRPLIRTPLGILGLNIANEPVTAAYRMPFMKGLYDAADSLPGYRIAYLTSITVVDSIARLGLWILIFIGLQFLPAEKTLQLSFVLASVCSVGIMLERFDALKEK